MPIIKRYANRKLYNTEAKQYIALEGIAELIRRGADIQVIDHESGDDITAKIQAQIIFKQEKNLGGVLPRTVLTNLIQAGSQTLTHLRQSLIPPAEWKAGVDAEIERRVQILIQRGQLTEDEGLHLLDKLLTVEEPPAYKSPVTDAELQRALQQRDLPSRADLDRIARQVEALNAELDKLVASNASETKP